MALQVWLPLNGDLKNKGCADVTVVNNGATVDNNGKIGKCYSFNGDKQWLQLDKPLADLYNGDFSWALWVKPTDHTRGILISEYSGAGASNVALELYTNRKIRIYWNAAVDWFLDNYALPIDTWTHIAVTRQSTTVKVYINGTFLVEKTGSFGNRSSSCCIRFGDDYRGNSGNSVSFKGFLNDIRIYNHCLSPKEIKEISQGLILHYPLNHVFTKNLINFDLTNDNYTITNYSNRTPGTISNGVYHANGYQSETSIDTSFGILSKNYITLKANTDYYLSFYCKSKSTGDLYFGTTGQAYTGLRDDSTNFFRPIQTFSIGKEYSGYVILKIHTGTPTQYRINLGFDAPNIYGIGSFIEFSKIVLSEVEPDFNACIENVVTDSSGYGNHGTITGNLTISNETSRYNSSVLFNGIDSCITIPYKQINPSGIFTMNLWFKKDSLGSKNYETLFGGPSGFEMDTRANNASTLSLYMTSTRGGSVFSPFNFGEWYMVTMVRDGTNEMYYINGELKKTIEAKSMPNGTYFIGAWQTEVKQNYFGNISDFRIYATPLSAEDVLQLYQVGASIDNLGNVHSYEIDEYLDEGRELLVRNITGSYSNTTSHRSNSLTFNGNSSAGSEYIEINPDGKKYIYDFTLSVAAGNQFDLGFERYDANKTARSNQACVYVYATKSSTDIVEKRFKGVVNLSTDGTNPCKYIRLRILNAWSGSDSNTVGTATVHQLSLREVSTSSTAKTRLLKTGAFETDLLREGNVKATIEKDVDMNINEFIET